MSEVKTEILTGDCLEVLNEYPENFFDFIITSPPYGDSRKKEYGEVLPGKS